MKLSEWTPREVREQQTRERQEAEEASQGALVAENQRLNRELGLKIRELVLTGADPDFVVPTTLPRSLKKSETFEFSTAEAQKLFALEEFKPFHTQENWNAICEYLERNGIDEFANFDCYKQAFERLLLLGLLTEKAEQPQPVIVVTPEPENDAVAERERKRQDYFTKLVVNYAGKDYSQADLDRLSADEYRRVVGLYGENLPRFSNVMKP